MIVNDKCSILWEVVRDDQHISMKMCIEPQNTLVLNNITNFSVPSLQNTTQYTKNITNQTMNISNPYNNTLNLSSPAPSHISSTISNYTSPSIAPSSIDKSFSSFVDEISPSPLTSLRGTINETLIPASDVVQQVPSFSPSFSPSSSFIEINNLAGIIIVISVSIVIISIACFLRIKYKKRLQVSFKKEKRKGNKYSGKVSPDKLARRPKDYIIEHLNKENKKTSIPHPPVKSKPFVSLKEVLEDPDTDGMQTLG